MSVNFANPYEQVLGNWYKGNLHAHSSPKSACAAIDPELLIASYVDCGYDFLSVSEHMEVHERKASGLTLIPGLEWNSRSGPGPDRVSRQDHLGVYAADHERVGQSLLHHSLEELLSAPQEGCLLVANHPDWHIEEHHDLQTLGRYAGVLAGMEIYNGFLETDEGQADACWKWDRLLSRDKPMFGFASDDTHCLDNIAKAWLMVRAEEGTSENLLSSLKSGNFYASTGVVIHRIGRDGDTLEIELDRAAEIRVIGTGGRLLKRSVADGLTWSFNDDADTSYARYQVRDGQWRQAWSQPFFRDSIPLQG